MPWPLYAEDPHWVPPLLMEVKEFLDRRKHPFYRHGEATQFLALRGGQAVGRILVSDDPHFNEQQQTNAGGFGLFECRRPGGAHGLLDAAAGWLRGRGRDRLIGPMDYSINYPCGLLVEGFDTPPRVMMNHNRRYYGGLLESWGLSKTTDLFAWWFVDPQDLVAKWKARAQRLGRSGRLVIRPFRRNDFAAEVPASRKSTAPHGRIWGAVKLTEAELRILRSAAEQDGLPEQVLMAEIDGRVVGVSVTLPDINRRSAP